MISVRMTSQTACNKLMLTIKTKINISTIEGIGLFADQYIPKGTVVWKFDPSIDLVLSKEEIDRLSKPSQEQFYKYAYLDKERGKYLLCGDDARFFNHSPKPNCDETIDNDLTIAMHNIEAGEELTINYKEFYGNMDEHPEITKEAVLRP